MTLLSAIERLYPSITGDALLQVKIGHMKNMDLSAGSNQMRTSSSFFLNLSFFMLRLSTILYLCLLFSSLQLM